MKKKRIVIKLLFVLILQQSSAQSSETITLLTPTQTIYLPAKVVLKNNVKDTLALRLFTKFTATEPKDLVVTESFLDYKIFFRDSSKSVSYKQSDVAYLEFVDLCGKTRIYSHIPDLKEKNIAEVIINGKINFYVVHSSNSFVGNSQGYIFVEKDGEWLTYKRFFNKKFYKKLQRFLLDEPDLVDKLNVEDNKSINLFELLKTYNLRKIKSLN